jgi:GNAT superfamily N-acetyltransferase
MILRPATAADTEALGRLHVQAWRETYAGHAPDALLQGLDPAKRAAMWDGVLTRTEVRVILAEVAGELAGFAASGPRRDPGLPSEAELRALYVLARAQRQGIGRALLRDAARGVRAAGMRTMSLRVLSGNTSARRFYAAMGAQEGTAQQIEEGWPHVSVVCTWPDVTLLAGE